jgi:ribosomal protein S12 methylthiotransferase
MSWYSGWSGKIVGKVCLVSLGCPKNLVDSENLLKRLADQGIEYESDPDHAEVLLINTCGFIEDAKRESIDEILNLVERKGHRKLVVFGCLAKRFGDELKREIPEIDALYGVGEEEKIAAFCGSILQASEALQDPQLLSETAYAYLKIAEGCDRGCSYCVIPDIRGRFRSRDPEEILKEAEHLVGSGRKELILVAQDITSYGRDMRGYTLERLVRDIASIRGDFWIRLLYLYPTSITDELLETLEREEKVCKYLDIPLQHTEQKILRLMGRTGSRELFRELINRIRRAIPEIALRTTLITGFPRETDDDFDHMLGFVEEMAFDRLGVFAYSREEGSSAYALKGQVPKPVRKKRRDAIMKVQAGISLEKNRKLVGRTFRALVDEADSDAAVARIYSQAPEIDGVVFIQRPGIHKNAFVQVRIDTAYDYDLKGSIAE